LRSMQNTTCFSHCANRSAFREPARTKASSIPSKPVEGYHGSPFAAHQSLAGLRIEFAK